jgi:O-methyltransferase/methyltransferase family protein
MKDIYGPGTIRLSKPPVDTLMQVSMGFTLPRTLHVIAELGIADAPDETPRSAEALATATGTDAEALKRTLRVLCAHGIFERQGGFYAHTPASRLLRSDHPQSMRSFVRMQGIPALWQIWEHSDHSLRTGRSAAEKTLPNGGFWGYFEDNPEHSRLFNDAMTGKTHGQTAGILLAYDFADFNSIADIGGGNGHLLHAILAATPNLKGVLFDLPHVIEQNSSVRSDRVELRAGNFFEDTLPTCDAYLMVQILHDWSDHEAATILKSIRRSAPPHAKLLLAEWLIPEDGEPSWTLYADLIMLGELTGKERSQIEFRELLAEAGFRLDRVIDVGFNTFVLESSVI